MKFLFKVIVIPILSIIAIPAIFLALTYKDVAIPIDDFQGDGTVTLTSMISDEVDTFLDTNDVDSTVGLHLTQQDANGMLKTAFLSQNPNYLSDTATDDEKNYVMKEDLYGYQGSWIRFKDENIVEIESGIHVFVSGFTYKTAVLLSFTLSADTEEIVLTLDKLNIGSLPLAWTFGTADWAVKQITGKDIQEMIDGQLNGLATFDADKREIILDVETLVTNSLQDEQSAALLNSLMQFISQNDLLDISFTDGEFSVDLALGKLKDDAAPFMLTTAEKIVDDAQLQSIMESKASSLIFSTLTTTDYPFIEFKQYNLSRMFEYFMRDPLVSAADSDGIIHQTMMFEDAYRITAYIPYVTIVDGVFKVNIPMWIEDVADPLKNFKTIIKITATPELNGSDLRIVLNELNAGEVSLSQEHIANVLSMLGDDGLIVDGAFVIAGFDEQMSQAGMGLQSVSVVGNRLRIFVELNDTIALGDIQDAVNDVLDAVVDNPDYSPELNTALNDVIDSLANPTGDPQAAIDDLLDVMDELTDEEQAEVYQDLIDAFGDTDIDYEDMLGLLP
ncbi:MAG: hypothetical protein CVV58_00510 [Tenericutes bacterium HGW-Tenericutes-3]|nr:MAG: hypothetical protein CVV58_00510 [Tenericutes bacterium HGW-Tenericutes-3]